MREVRDYRPTDFGLTFLDKDGHRITNSGVEGVKMIDYSRAIPDAPIHRGFDRFFGTACCPTTDFLYAFIDGDRIPFIVRWPGKVAAASISNQTVCLTDVMATCAAMTGATLPDNAAEDSFNLLPMFLGKDGGELARRYTLHQTISLALAIRRGPWKFLDHRGSGGNNYETPGLKPFALPDIAPAAPGQLYNLEIDPGETKNLYYEQPAIVQVLKALLETSKRENHDASRSPEQNEPHNEATTKQTKK